MFWLGKLAPVRAHFEQGMALYDPQQHRSHAFVYGQDPGVICRSHAAWPIWELGYPDQALQSIHEAMTLAQEIAHPFSLAFALVLVTIVYLYRREVQAAQEHAESVITIATEHGFSHLLVFGTIWRGWALTAQGEGTQGLAQIHKGLAIYRATGAEVHRPFLLSFLAEAYGKVRQPEEGLTVLDEALTLVKNNAERHFVAEIHRLKGELLQHLSSNHAAEAEGCFHHALDIARLQQAKSLELRAAMSLGRLWQHQGKQEKAHQLLAEIYGWFTEGFDTGDLREAKALLEELAWP